MSNRDYLTQHGWREHRTGTPPFKWSDPENRETRYDIGDAFEEQVHREAVRLHVAIAALGLAEPLLEAFATLNRTFASRDVGQRYAADVERALAAVRAAREGKQ